jgi:hypothetical protein
MVRKAYKGIGNEADGDGAAGPRRDPAALPTKGEKIAAQRFISAKLEHEEYNPKCTGRLPGRTGPAHPEVGISRGVKNGVAKFKRSVSG